MANAIKIFCAYLSTISEVSAIIFVHCLAGLLIISTTEFWSFYMNHVTFIQILQALSVFSLWLWTMRICLLLKKFLFPFRYRLLYKWQFILEPPVFSE